MNKYFKLLGFLTFCAVAGSFLGYIASRDVNSKPSVVLSFKSEPKQGYWFFLKRQSNIEYLYYGVPGSFFESKLIREFKVKTGIPGERPTPLPKVLDKDYWLITAKAESYDNSETAPYFLTLNIPISDSEPYGPENYMECDGSCNWELPGAFGLHGVGGDLSKLSAENPGSSGCIRHSDEDITYLYNLLVPDKEEIRYYIDNS